MKQRTFAANMRTRSPRNKGARLQLYSQAHRRCWYCGESVPKKAFRLDHQQPFSKGGKCHRSNLVVACVDCDTRKGAKTLEQFRQYWQGRLEVEFVFYGEDSKGNYFLIRKSRDPYLEARKN